MSPRVFRGLAVGSAVAAWLVGCSSAPTKSAGDDVAEPTGAGTAARTAQSAKADDDAQESAPPAAEPPIETKKGPPCTSVDSCMAACDDNDPWNCMRLADLYSKRKRTDENMKLRTQAYIKACALNHGYGCDKEGEARYLGWGIEKDQAAAMKLWIKSCELDYSDGCRSAVTTARHLEGHGDLVARARALEERIFPLAKAECDAASPKDEDDACLTVASYYQSGEHGAPRDEALAARMYDRLCREARSPFACSALAFMYKEGDGVKRSRRKAKKLIKRACELGDQEACDWGLDPP